MTDFLLARNANTSGTAGVADLKVPPARLVKCFGQPAESVERKVSGRYSFVDRTGRVFTVYDWKSTSRYDESLPTPEEFWSDRRSREFSIGSREETADEFKAWLLDQLRAART